VPGWGLIVRRGAPCCPRPGVPDDRRHPVEAPAGLTATLIREDGREGRRLLPHRAPSATTPLGATFEAQGGIGPGRCIEVRVTLSDDERMTYAVARTRGPLPGCSTAWSNARPWPGWWKRQCRGSPSSSSAPTSTSSPSSARCSRPGHPGLTPQPRAGTALRRLPRPARSRRLVGEQGGQTCRSTCRKRRWRSRSADVRLAAGGGPAGSVASCARRPAGGRRTSTTVVRATPSTPSMPAHRQRFLAEQAMRTGSRADTLLEPMRVVRTPAPRPPPALGPPAPAALGRVGTYGGYSTVNAPHLRLAQAAFRAARARRRAARAAVHGAQDSLHPTRREVPPS